GKRPEITDDTPECFVDLMESCWNNDPKKRPSMGEIRKTLGSWFFRNKNKEVFDQAEVRRNELINLRELGPEFTGKYHPKAIFTSRILSHFISEISSNNSTSEVSFYDNKGNVTNNK